MKLLFVTPQCPAPPRKGTTLRNYHLIAGAARRHDVQVLTILDPADDPAGPDLLRALGVGVTIVPAPARTTGRRLGDLVRSRLPDLALRLRSDAAQAAFVDLLHSFRPDVVQLEAVEAAGAVGPLGRAFRAAGVRAALIYDAHNAEFALQRTIWQTDVRRPSRLPFALYSVVQWRRLRRYEGALARATDAVLVVAPGDAALLAPFARTAPVVVPNGIDTTHYGGSGVGGRGLGDAGRRPLSSPDTRHPSPDTRTSPNTQHPTPNTLLFVGTLDFRPNVDAVRWFVGEVMPLVRRRVPGARLAIVGRTPAPAVWALEAPDVEVIGPVDDERPWFQRADVFVVPLRSGGGMRFKVVQAMACGTPVVSTRFGAEGVEVADGRELLLADDPAAFAEAIARTIADPAATAERVARGRALAVERYDWRAILPAVEAVYDRLAPVAAR